jgi:CheY-like chemotaxis protein
MVCPIRLPSSGYYRSAFGPPSRISRRVPPPDTAPTVQVTCRWLRVDSGGQILTGVEDVLGERVAPDMGHAVGQASPPGERTLMPARRVPIVDDDPAFCELLASAIEDEGLAAASCHTTADAWRAIQQERPVVLVLDDWLEQAGTGVAFLETLRADPTTAAIPVVLCSADARLRRQVAALARLRCYLIEKPFDLESFGALLRPALGEGNGLASADHTS